MPKDYLKIRRIPAQAALPSREIMELVLRYGLSSTSFLTLYGGFPVRCPYCQGEIRIHRNRVVDGPQDHFEHIWGEDSRRCIAGVLSAE
jgi:hypothetical protein